jgi:hypothetical protein
VRVVWACRLPPSAKTINDKRRINLAEPVRTALINISNSLPVGLIYLLPGTISFIEIISTGAGAVNEKLLASIVVML